MRARLAIAAALLVAPAAAQADPITAAIFGSAIIGTVGGAVITAVITFALTTLVTLIASKLFGPKQNAQDRQASIASLSIGESPREALFGEVATGGTLADAFNYGGTDGTDWEVQVIIVADHRCAALASFFVGDVSVPFVADGAVAGYNNQLMLWWRNGTETQVLPDVVTTQGGWAASDNLAGCATIVVAYKADDPKSQSPIWTGGRPSFLWVVRGKHLYSPRKDSSVGGSGTHRWADPSTWEWSDNVIDCRYNWERGIYACDRVDQPGMLLVGRGLTTIEAPPADTFAPANTCDELVALKAGGTEKRYRCNVVVRADEQYIATEEAFAAACAGIIRQPQGSVAVEPGSARSVVAEIVDTDLIAGEKVTFNRFRTDTQRVNSIVPRYIEPTQKWADHAAPIRRDLADLTADGGPREETLSLIAVTSNTQAQRCGEIRRRMARLERTATITLGPRWAHLEEGDWIGWTSARYLGGARVVFRVASYSLPANWRNSLQLEEIAASVFDWTAATDEVTPQATAAQQAVPTAAAPVAADWTATGTALSGSGGSVPAIVITGTVNNGRATNVLFEYRVNGTAAWVGGATAPATTTRWEITSVQSGTAYDVAVSYIVSGVQTTRLVLGPVTPGSVAVARGAYQVTSQSVAYPITTDDTHAMVAAYNVVIDDGSSLALPAATIGGLAASTAYGVFRDLAAGTYVTEINPAATHMASSGYLFLAWVTTSSSGTYAAGGSAPGGWRGRGTSPQ